MKLYDNGSVMNCPKCGTPLPDGWHTCKHCGARITRPSDKIARQMTSSGRFAMVCGGLMLLLAGCLFFYGEADLLWQSVLIILGLLLLYVGKKMT
jgi:uncharacterized membrane protein YvbJ